MTNTPKERSARRSGLLLLVTGLPGGALVFAALETPKHAALYFGGAAVLFVLGMVWAVIPNRRQYKDSSGTEK